MYCTFGKLVGKRLCNVLSIMVTASMKFKKQVYLGFSRMVGSHWSCIWRRFLFGLKLLIFPNLRYTCCRSLDVWKLKCGQEMLLTAVNCLSFLSSCHKLLHVSVYWPVYTLAVIDYMIDPFTYFNHQSTIRFVLRHSTTVLMAQICSTPRGVCTRSHASRRHGVI